MAEGIDRELEVKKRHYYSDNKLGTGDTPATFGDDTTACGKNGRKTGGFISFFFRQTDKRERCKICNKQFINDEQNRNNLED